MSFYEYRQKETVPDPWVEMPKEIPPKYKCEECGWEFTPREDMFRDGGYRIWPARGASKIICDECFDALVQESADTLGGKFIRSDEEILDEFMKWWWDGLSEFEQMKILRAAYTENERHKDFLESDFAYEHGGFADYVRREYEGEKL